MITGHNIQKLEIEDFEKWRKWKYPDDVDAYEFELADDYARDFQTLIWYFGEGPVK